MNLWLVGSSDVTGTVRQERVRISVTYASMSIHGSVRLFLSLISSSGLPYLSSLEKKQHISHALSSFIRIEKKKKTEHHLRASTARKTGDDECLTTAAEKIRRGHGGGRHPCYTTHFWHGFDKLDRETGWDHGKGCESVQLVPSQDIKALSGEFDVSVSFILLANIALISESYAALQNDLPGNGNCRSILRGHLRAVRVVTVIFWQQAYIQLLFSIVIGYRLLFVCS